MDPLQFESNGYPDLAATEGAFMISAIDLYKSFRLGQTDIHVLNGVSLEIKRGEIVAKEFVDGGIGLRPAEDERGRLP